MSTDSRRPGKRSWAAIGLLVVLALLGWWLLSGTGQGQTTAAPQPLASTTTTSQPASKTATPKATTANPAPTRTQSQPKQQDQQVDPVSGLPWIAATDLPREAQRTLELIDRGGPFPYDKDGVTFGNFEGVLPQQRRGYYQEYTVDTPGVNHRGARRIVTGDNNRIQYWTDDHYETFKRIRR